MPHVESEQVAHIWAQQNSPDDSAEGSARTRFFGEFIYSYAEPIGRIYCGTGTRCVLIRDKKFSVTTSKHQGWMRSAVSHLPCFEVSDLGELGKAPNHKANIAHFQYRIEQLAQKGKTRIHPATADKIRSLSADANRYCEFFGLKHRFDETCDIQSILAGARKRTAREESKKRRDEAAQIVRENERVKRARENALLWIEGKECERFDLPMQYARIEGDELVTTLGARVPLKHAKRAAKSIAKILNAGIDWHCNGDQIHVGHFQIESISKDGILCAGCHTFEAAEVKRILAILA